MSDALEQLVERVTREVLGEKAPAFTAADYPLMQKHPELIRTPTGKPIAAITMEAVRAGEVVGEDLRISREMLGYQAAVAEGSDKPQMAQNLRRAAELTGVPDEVVITMYDLLRPNRATKIQLLEMAETLKEQYQAPLCAALVTQAVEVYEQRGILKQA